MPRCVLLAAVVGTLWAAAPAAADAPESLPPPRVLAQPGAEPPPAYPPPVIVRRNPYEVWQFYGVDRRGFFRPLVVYSPYGPYYRYNGEPYPWAATHQLDFMPYIVDAPEGLGPPPRQAAPHVTP